LKVDENNVFMFVVAGNWRRCCSWPDEGLSFRVIREAGENCQGNNYCPFVLSKS